MSLKPLAVLALLAAAPLPAQTPIAPGQTVTGTLQEGDARMEGSYYDAYVVRGRPGERVLVRMHSEDFDAYLASGRVSDGEWSEESSDDDAGGSTDARVLAYLGEDGRVELRAAAADEDEVGGYTLSVILLGEPPTAPVRPGQTVRGRLERTDHEGVAGYEDYYAIQAAEGDTVTIQVESGEFDAAVALGGMHRGRVFVEDFDDDGGPGTDATLATVVGGPEPYYLVVHAFMPGSTGAYTLRVLAGAHPGELEWPDDKRPTGSGAADTVAWTEADTAVVMDSIVWSDTAMVVDGVVWMDTTIAATADTVSWTEADDQFTDSAAVMPYLPRALIAGTTVEGVLDEGARDEDGRWFQHFVYTARAGERLRISLSSDEVDPRVAVGTGTLCRVDALAEDDNGGRGWNAELEWTAPASGEYVIRVTTAVPGETGIVMLRVDSLP
jgi:hypothetical protein